MTFYDKDSLNANVYLPSTIISSLSAKASYSNWDNFYDAITLHMIAAGEQFNKTVYQLNGDGRVDDMNALREKLDDFAGRAKLKLVAQFYRLHQIKEDALVINDAPPDYSTFSFEFGDAKGIDTRIYTSPDSVLMIRGCPPKPNKQSVNISETGKIELKTIVNRDAISKSGSQPFRIESIHFISYNKELAEDFGKIFTYITQEDKAESGEVYIISQGPNRMSLNELGKIDKPLVRTNYNSEVLKNYDFVVSQFSKSDPAGKIVLIQGPPGTGKTYLVQALISSISNSCFVYVPPDLISNISNPSFISMLLSERRDLGEEKNFTLILEDAESCLAKRDGGNNSDVTSLLNISEGIVGSLLNIRIIATTNAKIEDFDDAIRRPGRLCKMFSVSKLSRQEAVEAFNHVCENKLEFPNIDQEEFTLAEVYFLINLIRNDQSLEEFFKFKKDSDPKRKMGF